MKLVASAMLSAAITRQYSSLLPLLRHYKVSAKFAEHRWILYFFVWVTLIEIVNTLLDRSAASVLPAVLQLHWHPLNPARNLAVAGLGRISEKNGRIADFPELERKSGTTLDTWDMYCSGESRCGKFWVCDSRWCKCACFVLPVVYTCVFWWLIMYLWYYILRCKLRKQWIEPVLCQGKESDSILYC